MRVHTLCFISASRTAAALCETSLGVYASDTLAHTAMREHFFAFDGWNNQWQVTDAKEDATCGKLYRAYNDEGDRMGWYSIREHILK